MLFHRFGIYDVAYWDLGQARLISQIGNKVKPLWQPPSRTKRKGRLFGVGPSPCGSRARHSRKPSQNCCKAAQFIKAFGCFVWSAYGSITRWSNTQFANVNSRSLVLLFLMFFLHGWRRHVCRGCTGHLVLVKKELLARLQGPDTATWYVARAVM